MRLAFLVLLTCFCFSAPALKAQEREKLPSYKPRQVPVLSAKAYSEFEIIAQHKDETLNLQQGEPKRLTLVSQRKVKELSFIAEKKIPFIMDFFCDSQGTSYVTWGNGGNGGGKYAISKVRRDGSIEPAVPLSSALPGKGDLGKGQLSFFDGSAAIDGNGDFFITLGKVGTNAIIKFDSQNETFIPIAQIHPSVGVNVYDFDPEAVYLTSSFQIHRFVFPGTSAGGSSFEATSHLAIRGIERESIYESQAITADQWIIRLYNSKKRAYRTLLIDLEAESFHEMPELQKLLGLGINRAGNLICITGQDILTFKLDGLK